MADPDAPAPDVALRQGCECQCCDHSEGSDCACVCHATSNACAFPALAPPQEPALDDDVTQLRAFLRATADHTVAESSVKAMRALDRLAAADARLRLLHQERTGLDVAAFAKECAFDFGANGILNRDKIPNEAVAKYLAFTILAHLHPATELERKLVAAEAARDAALRASEDWRTAALLKDRTRRAIRERHLMGERDADLAADYGVPLVYVEALVAVQLFGDEK